MPQQLIILTSLILLMIGNGLATTLTPLTLQHAASATAVVSIITASNFIGQIMGSVFSKPFIQQWGYKTSFIMLAIIIAATSFLQGNITLFWCWLIIRFINGYCLSAIYVIIESWLLALTAPTNRNKILAFYMTSFYAATACGQFCLTLMNPWGITIWLFITLISISATFPLLFINSPLATVKNQTYMAFAKLYHNAFPGLVSCAIAGMILGTFYSFGPLSIQTSDDSANKAAYFMGFTIAGGMLGQLPIGYLADKIRREQVLLWVTAMTTLTAFALINANNYPPFLINIFAFSFGFFSFTLYPLSLSCALKMVQPNHYMATTGTLILVYSIGSALGPAVTGILTNYLATPGIFLSITLASGFLYLFLRYQRQYSRL